MRISSFATVLRTVWDWLWRTGILIPIVYFVLLWWRAPHLDPRDWDYDEGINLMKALQRQLGLTYLLISHNLAVVAHVADRVGVMYLGRLVELAGTRQLFERPLHPYARMLLDAIPDIAMSGKPRACVAGEVPNPLDPPTGCTFHPRCPQANDRCRRERPNLLPVGTATVACHAVEEGRLAMESRA